MPRESLRWRNLKDACFLYTFQLLLVSCFKFSTLPNVRLNVHLCILLQGPAFSRPTSHSSACTLGLALGRPWGCLSLALCIFQSVSCCCFFFFSFVVCEGHGHRVFAGLRPRCLGVRQLKLLALLSSPRKTKTFLRKAGTGPSLFEVFDCDLNDFFTRGFQIFFPSSLEGRAWRRRNTERWDCNIFLTSPRFSCALLWMPFWAVCVAR